MQGVSLLRNTMESSTIFTKSREDQQLANSNRKEFLISGAYTDVTLVADGTRFRAHRVILCATSPYFKELLPKSSDKEPLLILDQRVTANNLKLFLDFVYEDKVRVPLSSSASFTNMLKLFGITCSPAPPAPEVRETPMRTLLRASMNSIVSLPNLRLGGLKRMSFDVTGATSSKKSVSFVNPAYEDLRIIGRKTNNSLGSAEFASPLKPKEADKENTRILCSFCGKTLANPRSCLGHEKCCKQNPDRECFMCGRCGSEFARKDTLWKHQQRLNH